MKSFLSVILGVLSLVYHGENKTLILSLTIVYLFYHPSFPEKCVP